MQLRIYAQKIISFLDEFDIPSAVVAVLLFLGTGTCTDSRVLIYAIILFFNLLSSMIKSNSIEL